MKEGERPHFKKLQTPTAESSAPSAQERVGGTVPAQRSLDTATPNKEQQQLPRNLACPSGRNGGGGGGGGEKNVSSPRPRELGLRRKKKKTEFSLAVAEETKLPSAPAASLPWTSC